MSLFTIAPPHLRPVAARQLVRELASQLRDPPAALVFDADGTLWFADVGDDVFLDSLERGLIRDEARPALAESAARHGLRSDGSATELARTLRNAFRAGAFPERELYEVMTWCYAGWTPDELVEHAQDVLTRGQITRRLNPELAPVLEWARRAGIYTVIVSASPQPIVELAARLWNFGPEDVVAAKPAIANGRIAARLAAPLPFGRTKVCAAEAKLGRHSWLASFGDSAFDFEMLVAARVGVAVSPKPELRARIVGIGAQPTSIAETCKTLTTATHAQTHVQKKRDWTRSSSQT